MKRVGQFFIRVEKVNRVFFQYLIFHRKYWVFGLLYLLLIISLLGISLNLMSFAENFISTKGRLLLLGFTLSVHTNAILVFYLFFERFFKNSFKDKNKDKEKEESEK